MGLNRRSCFPFGFGLLVLLGKPLLLLPSSGNHIIGLHFIRASQRYPGSPHLLSLFPLQLCHRLLRPPWVRRAGLGLIAIRQTSLRVTLHKRVSWHGEDGEKNKHDSSCRFFLEFSFPPFAWLRYCGGNTSTYAPRKSLHPGVFFLFFLSIACLTQAEREECVGLPGCCEVVAISSGAEDLLDHAPPIYLHQGFQCRTGCPDL